MRWDPVQIERSKKFKAETELRSAIEGALDAGFNYENICKVAADVIERRNNTKNESVLERR